MSPSRKIVVLATVAVFAALVYGGDATFLPKREGLDYTGSDMIIDPKKRPFCNAFTGCGRKRSNLPPVPERQFQTNPRRILDESLSNLLELNSEPGLEDLSRQILSEAKLWEAIQEAGLELRRQQEALDKQQEAQRNVLN